MHHGGGGTDARHHRTRPEVRLIHVLVPIKERHRAGSFIVELVGPAWLTLRVGLVVHVGVLLVRPLRVRLLFFGGRRVGSHVVGRLLQARQRSLVAVPQALGGFHAAIHELSKARTDDHFGDGRGTALDMPHGSHDPVEVGTRGEHTLKAVTC